MDVNTMHSDDKLDTNKNGNKEDINMNEDIMDKAMKPKEYIAHEVCEGQNEEKASLLQNFSITPTTGRSASQTHLYNKTININRPIYDQVTFDELYGKVTCQQSQGQQIIQYCHKKCSCSVECFKKKLVLLFPFIMTLKTYQWKNWILGDIIAGLCVGAIHIPQSMGFSILSSLPPVYGLYSTFFPLVIYFFFGTSRHISMGTMAVISIMIGTVVDRETDLFLLNNQTSIAPQNGTDIGEELVSFKLGIAVSLTCMIGVFQFIMSFIKMGTLATFMSSSFVGGFMTGAAAHIITSQIPFALGYKIPPQTGIFRLPKTWYFIFANIAEINPADIITFIICSAVLVIFKVINDKFSNKLKIPVPGELIVIVLGILISYVADFHNLFNMRILKDIPTGFPAPTVPCFYNFQAYIFDAFIISLVSYSICISFAKSFSQKYRYQIDQNQEFFALGLMHFVSSFFQSFAGAQAPPRTLVTESAGGKTQLASLFAAALVLLVCLVLAPAFEPLPNTVLASVIVIAVAPLFKQIAALPHLWEINRQDCIVWIVTFLSCVLLNVDFGLVIGVAMSLLSLVIETHLARGQILSQVNQTEIYQSQTVYSNLKPPLSQSNVFIFKFDSPLYFANVEAFKKQLFKSTIDPLQTTKKGKHNGSTIKETDTKNVTDEVLEDKPINSIRFIVLDCSGISYIDVMGLNTLKLIGELYKDVDVELFLCHCSQLLLHKMEVHGMSVDNAVYPTIHDAVFTATHWQF